MSTDDQNLARQLCQTMIKDKKKDRLWRNIRFFTWVILFILLFFSFNSPSDHYGSANHKTPHFALIQLKGAIMPGSDFSVAKVIPELSHAFRDKKARGVVLLINSPGGTPTQATIIHDKIISLKKQFHKKVIVVAEDSLTSGAYLVATAADKIYVNEDTVTGSIGVIMSSFGLTGAIEKLGITRRVYTAGLNKDRLDPFLPENPKDKAKIQSILTTVHNNFIAVVKAGRKGKLRGSPAELFSGDFWLGKKATELGLVDGTMNLWDAAKKNFGTTHYIDYTTHHTFLDSLFKNIGTITQLSLHAETHSQLLAEQP